jgi:DNA-binding response OmpR family regulator
MPDKKILLVEDDKMISSMYETKLRQDGYMIILADNGAMAIDLAVKEKPDIILLDIILPQLDGFAVLQEVKSIPGTKNIPIIMLTNLGTTEDQEKGKQLGATAYFVKANLTPAQISEKVKEFLQ